MNQDRGHLHEPQTTAEESPEVRIRPKLDPTTKNRYATEEEIQLAGRALQDLSLHRLKIALVPAPDPHFEGHKVRTIEETNPDWYQDFVEGRWNREGCQVKRGRVLNAMKRVHETGVIRSNGYETQILPHLAKYPPRPEW